MRALRYTASAALLVLFTACGGGGGSASTTPAVTPAATSASLAQMCAPENPLVGDALAKTRSGTLSDEKNWIRAYMSERYLWYRDIPTVNADNARYQVTANGATNAIRALANYFYDSLTPLKTASGAAVDKFSFLIDTSSWNSFVGSTDLGYGWMLKSSSPTGQRVVTVSYVYPNSPAMAAGIQRGDQVVSIDGALASDSSATATATFNEGAYPTRVASHAMVLSRAGTSLSKTLVASTVNLQQAEYKLVSSNGRTAGYLLFNSHVPNAEDDLIKAITLFKQQNVKDLVIDLRYNTGGYLSIANALAYAVAGDDRAKGRVFEWARYSDKRSSENYPMTFSNLGLSNQVYPTLGLSKIYVLVSGSTCSASESFVNGLRGIDVEVELIGTATCGKPYGFVPQDNCGLTYAAMEIEGVNAKGEGGFSDGMTPQCTVNDDVNHSLGDPSEAMLAVALKRMQGIACTQAAGLTLGATSLAGMALRDEGVLMRPQWQQNKILPTAR